MVVVQCLWAPPLNFACLFNGPIRFIQFIKTKLLLFAYYLLRVNLAATMWAAFAGTSETRDAPTAGTATPLGLSVFLSKAISRDAD